MTAINNIKISSNNSAIDGLKSKKNDLGFKSIFNSLEISELNIKENPKKIENNSKEHKKKNNLKEENLLNLEKKNDKSNKKENKDSENVENENNVKKLTKKDEENITINSDDSSVNQTNNIKILTNFEHLNSKQFEKDKISIDERNKLKIFSDEKNKSKTFSFDFQLVNEEVTEEKKNREKLGINIDSSILKNKLENNQEKNNLSYEKKKKIKTSKVKELNEFFTDKEFQDFKNLVSNKEKLISKKNSPELNLNRDFIEKTNISKPTPINIDIKKIDIKKFESDQKFDNQFSELLDDFDSPEEEVQHFELDNSKTIREQLIKKNEISQNLIQRFSEFLGSRIINQINSGRWETNIVLRPERLGKLNVKINLDKGEFKANFSTSNSVSRDILIEAIPKLKLNLENSGINVASVNVEVFTSSDRNHGNQKNYIYNQELNKNNQIDSENEVKDTVNVQKINFSVDGIDIVI